MKCAQLPLSLVVITLNEEKNLRRCLQSVPFAQEIIVVDSGSTDRTVEIAKELGAKVVHQPWLGFGPQKQFAVDLAANRWVLSLDADEALSEDLQSEILQCFGNLGAGGVAGFDMPRKSFHLGRWILYGGWYPDYQLRLFDKEKARWQDSQLHERVECPSKERLKGDLLHFVFHDLADQIETNNRYSTLGAKSLAQAGKSFSIFKLCLKPVSKFLETFFWKRGFLDGLPGFIIAVGASYSVFLKFAKLYEDEKLRKGRLPHG